MFSRSVRSRRTSRMRMGGGGLTLSVRPANDAPVAAAAAAPAKPKNNTSRGMRLGLAANGGKSEKKPSRARRLGMSESNRGQSAKKAGSRPRLGLAKPAEAAKKEESKPRARLGMAKK